MNQSLVDMASSARNSASRASRGWAMSESALDRERKAHQQTKDGGLKS